MDRKLVLGYKEIVRNDTESTLSVMKNSYSAMKNSEFLDIVGKIQEISGFSLAGFNEFKGGNKVLAFLENNRKDFKIGGNRIDDYLLLGNSFDGTTSFFQGTSTEIIRCSNQFSSIKKHSKFRHTKSLNRKLEEFYSYLDTYFNQRDRLFKTFEEAGNISLTEELQEQMIKFVLNVKEVTDKEISAQKQKQIDLLRNTMMREMIDLGKNMWCAFNGVTFYTTHEVVSKHSTFGNVLGKQADINTRAMSFVDRQLGRKFAEDFLKQQN